MIVAVWGVGFVPLSLALPSTSTAACQADDPCTDLDSVLSYLCHRLSLVSFSVSDISFVSLVVYHLFTTF